MKRAWIARPMALMIQTMTAIASPRRKKKRAKETRLPSMRTTRMPSTFLPTVWPYL